VASRRSGTSAATPWSRSPLPASASCCGHTAEDLAGLLDDESVQLFCSSPPFPLNRRKCYANQHPARAHVEWLLRLVERFLPKLAPEGSLVLEVGRPGPPGEPTRAT